MKINWTSALIGAGLVVFGMPLVSRFIAGRS